jgi:Cytochrome c.
LSDVAAEGAIALLMLGLVSAAGAVGWVVGHYTRTSPTRTVTVSATQPAATTATSTNATTTATGTGGGDPVAGKAVFASAGCAGCHTLKAAGASGTVGPNLDQAKPSAALVVDRVTHGKGGMPSFAAQLSEQQIKDVAAFVVSSG